MPNQTTLREEYNNTSGEQNSKKDTLYVLNNSHVYVRLFYPHVRLGMDIRNSTLKWYLSTRGNVCGQITESANFCLFISFCCIKTESMRKCFRVKYFVLQRCCRRFRIDDFDDYRFLFLFLSFEKHKNRIYCKINASDKPKTFENMVTPQMIYKIRS